MEKKEFDIKSLLLTDFKEELIKQVVPKIVKTKKGSYNTLSFFDFIDGLLVEIVATKCVNGNNKTFRVSGKINHIECSDDLAVILKEFID